jgi:hypothetical protein
VRSFVVVIFVDFDRDIRPSSMDCVAFSIAYVTFRGLWPRRHSHSANLASSFPKSFNNIWHLF